MKHLKTFENLSLKKYVVIDVPYISGKPMYIMLIEIISFTTDTYYIKFHYSYTYKDNEIEKDNNNEIFNYDVSFFKLNPILFQSDSLDDCMKYLELIQKSNTYKL